VADYQSSNGGFSSGHQERFPSRRSAFREMHFHAGDSDISRFVGIEEKMEDRMMMTRMMMARQRRTVAPRSRHQVERNARAMSGCRPFDCLGIVSSDVSVILP
jgi:hypothetical protein